MKLVITSDSEFLSARLLSLFSGIASLEISALVKNMSETLNAINTFAPEVLILSLHHTDESVSKYLKDIKLLNQHLLIIVLSDDTSIEYFNWWKKAGADYIFDKAFHFDRIIEVLCDLLYKQQQDAINSAENIRIKH